MFGWGKKDVGTFRPVKKMPKGSRTDKLKEINRSHIEAGNYEAAVKLPPGEKLDDWVATNLIEFFNQLSCLYAPIAEYCTPQSCPETTAGPGYKYYWQDNNKYKKPTMLPASEYISNVMSWAESYLNNEEYFPSDPYQPFAPDFRPVVANIFKRLFRIYAHIYHHHMDQVVKMGAEAHLHSSFKHFATFCKEFKLIPADQMAPLAQVMASF